MELEKVEIQEGFRKSAYMGFVSRNIYVCVFNLMIIIYFFSLLYKINASLHEMKLARFFFYTTKFMTLNYCIKLLALY